MIGFSISGLFPLHHFAFSCTDNNTFFLQILGFGVALLDGVDPNPANFVGAGVIHTKSTQVGCLLRLEPNTQAEVKVKHTHTHTPNPVLNHNIPIYRVTVCVFVLVQMYRLTLRTSRDSVSQRLCDLLSEQF